MSGYSDEKQVQILISLLKQYGIRKAIISPGATNMSFVASLMYDGSFELYSCPDERSAAYMACGMAVESREPVIISCTGATASREYLAALTEAYYRKIPILAITSSQSTVNAENLSPQFIDRSVVPKDAVKYSTHIQFVRGLTDEWDCNLKINRALNALFEDGGGPVHINLTTVYSMNYLIQELPPSRMIKVIGYDDAFPIIREDYKIAISCGAYWRWDDELEKMVGDFCEQYDVVCFVDHTSGYHGKHAFHPTILFSQENEDIIDDIIPDLVIHIGELSGDYYTYHKLFNCKEVWRISEDGKIRDTFHKLTYFFNMPLKFFFDHYLSLNVSRVNNSSAYYKKCEDLLNKAAVDLDKVPFSNIWIAGYCSKRFPAGSILHMGVSNTMRSWNFFDIPNRCYANVGVRGIDGTISTAIGASLAAPDKIVFCVCGDLTFFYDINSLGNRHIGNNLRIILINNNGGAEFHLYQHMGFITMGEDVSKFVAADGHNGNKSKDLIRHYAEDLGFEYMSAVGKEDFIEISKTLLDPLIGDRPILVEVFTDHKNESDALKYVRTVFD